MVRSTSSWSSWSLQTNISHSKRITPSVTHVWDMLFDNMGNVIQLLFCHNARHPWTTKSLLESWPNSIRKDASFVAVCTSVFRAWQMRGSQLPHGCWIQSLHIFHGSNFVLDIPVSTFNTTLLMWVSGSSTDKHIVTTPPNKQCLWKLIHKLTPIVTVEYPGNSKICKNSFFDFCGNLNCTFSLKWKQNVKFAKMIHDMSDVAVFTVWAVTHVYQIHLYMLPNTTCIYYYYYYYTGKD